MKFNWTKILNVFSNKQNLECKIPQMFLELIENLRFFPGSKSMASVKILFTNFWFAVFYLSWFTSSERFILSGFVYLLFTVSENKWTWFCFFAKVVLQVNETKELSKWNHESIQWEMRHFSANQGGVLRQTQGGLLLQVLMDDLKGFV